MICSLHKERHVGVCQGRFGLHDTRPDVKTGVWLCTCSDSRRASILIRIANYPLLDASGNLGLHPRCLGHYSYKRSNIKISNLNCRSLMIWIPTYDNSLDTTLSYLHENSGSRGRRSTRKCWAVKAMWLRGVCGLGFQKFKNESNPRAWGPLRHGKDRNMSEIFAIIKAIISRDSNVENSRFS
jgi:hypothetical protein